MPPVLDCTAAVLDGVWPYELARPRPETEAISRYLHDDLLRIVETTNERLAELQARDLHPEARRYAEDRFIRTARAMAVLRVESTVRQMGGMSILASPGMPELMRPPERPQRRPVEVTGVARPTRPVEETRVIAGPGMRRPWQSAEADTTSPVEREDLRQLAQPPGPVVDAQVVPLPRHSSPDPEVMYESSDWSEQTRVVQVGPSAGVADRGVDGAREVDGAEVRPAFEPVAPASPAAFVEPESRPLHVPPPSLPRPAPTSPPVAAAPAPAPTAPPVNNRRPEPAPAPTAPPVNNRRPEPAPALYLAPARSSTPAAAGFGSTAQGGQVSLQQLVGSLARQEPSLKWLIGERPDGSTVVVTDVLCGWIPPGVVLPVGLTVLTPQRREGRMEDWVGALQGSARYAPGDRIDGRHATSTKVIEEPFAVVEVADNLGWSLGEATHLHEGIPRIVHTLARAAAAGAGVNEAELDVLRVHVETAVQTMLSAYPDVNEQTAVSCMLMGATEAMAGQQAKLAAYHFGWYQAFAGRRWE